ncbi:hypothetical protein Nepgr_032275 [Nepenthes gracilis]|uniref:Reverse transcriptase domain-containing protein n=1 Tax=Nepenthes gracilis TaxID=150966 RepID=A0AAD3Y5I7_NEPGR|nr:hypothetical protein Nepgr_032275 [Nepenthes gracilis]
MENVKNLIVDHFSKALGIGRSYGSVSADRIRPYILHTVPESLMDLLVGPVSDDEIRKTIFSIGDYRAPGPDGFSAHFFKEAWDIMGPSVCEAIRDFFNHGLLLKQMNSTIISLIPKVQSPRLVSDYRPISCYNVIYKVISKIIANRLKMRLSYLVDKCQTAFVAGRHISDNILLAQELLHKYHLGHGPPRCTLKIDLMKAYDSIHWDFIISVLTIMNFPPKMIN